VHWLVGDAGDSVSQEENHYLWNRLVQSKSKEDGGKAARGSGTAVAGAKEHEREQTTNGRRESSIAVSTTLAGNAHVSHCFCHELTVLVTAVQNGNVVRLVLAA
jgi:hypothetical protein